MLYFIGIGVAGVGAMSIGAREAIAASRIIYVERFTSPIPDVEIAEIKRIAEESNTSFKVAPRWMVEDGSEILREARTGDVALVCYGDPYVATTHIELRARAMTQNIPTRSVHGASALTSMIGECGLHHYKVGRTSTITRSESSTPYAVLHANMQLGCHTVLLLEYDADSGHFLEPREALESLLATEADARHGAATPETFAIIASRVGRNDQALTAGCISTLLEIDFGRPPHSIIVPGSLHFTESDAVGALARCVDKPQANSDSSKKVAHRMISKYAPMIRQAIRDERDHGSADDGVARVLDGAQNYVSDSEEFLKSGRDELAILSIGYADGLVDALRIVEGRPHAWLEQANKEGPENA